MARGMVNGEPVVSQASTDEFREGYERTFGKPDGSAKGGRWVWDEAQQKLVPADEYVPPAAKTGTGIMVDRFMEGDRAPDGSDIGSRRKRKDWMRATDTVEYDDFKGARERRQKEEAARARGEFKPDKALREHLGRELYKAKIIT